MGARSHRRGRIGSGRRTSREGLQPAEDQFDGSEQGERAGAAKGGSAQCDILAPAGDREAAVLGTQHPWHREQVPDHMDRHEGGPHKEAVLMDRKPSRARRRPDEQEHDAAYAHDQSGKHHHRRDHAQWPPRCSLLPVARVARVVPHKSIPDARQLQQRGRDQQHPHKQVHRQQLVDAQDRQADHR